MNKSEKAFIVLVIVFGVMTILPMIIWYVAIIKHMITDLLF